MIRNPGNALALAVLFVPALCGCGSPPEPWSVERRMLGTSVVITCYDHGSSAEKAVESAFSAMGGIGRIMNRFDPESELSKLNAAAGGGWRSVSPDLYGVIERSVAYSRMTGGSFDVTVLPMMKLWNFKAEAPRAPSKDETNSALRLVGCANVGLDAGGRKISLARKGMGMDLGGIAKGYAVDRGAEALRRGGVESAMVIGGGNIALIGLPPGRDRWRIGVRHPRIRGLEIGLIGVVSGAVATSGDYERYVTIDGKRYSHILDPKTGWPTTHDVASVTILAATAEKADALSTAVFVMGAEKGMDFVESRPGVEAVIVTIGESGEPDVLLSSGVRDSYMPIIR